MDPDFRYTKRFDINVEPLIGILYHSDTVIIMIQTLERQTIELINTSNFVNVYFSLGKLSDDSVEDGAISSVAPRQFKSKLEEALTAKQESEAKVATLMAKLQQYETDVKDYKHKVWHERTLHIFT